MPGVRAIGCATAPWLREAPRLALAPAFPRLPPATPFGPSAPFPRPASFGFVEVRDDIYVCGERAVAESGALVSGGVASWSERGAKH